MVVWHVCCVKMVLPFKIFSKIFLFYRMYGRPGMVNVTLWWNVHLRNYTRRLIWHCSIDFFVSLLITTLLITCHLRITWLLTTKTWIIQTVMVSTFGSFNMLLDKAYFRVVFKIESFKTIFISFPISRASMQRRTFFLFLHNFVR